MQFIKKTSFRQSILGLLGKITLIIFIIIGIVFFVNKIDFPTPKNEIDKTIPNENFKIVK